MEKPFTTLNDLARALASVMNLISPEVQNHHQKVAYLAWQLADEMGLSPQEKLAAMGGALLHDVGSVTHPGNLSLKDLERDAATLARIGASMMKNHALTRGLTDIILNCQTPWRSFRGPRLLTPILIGQIVHLSDAVSLLLNDAGSALNQLGQVRAAIDQTGDREFHPEVRRAFDALCDREAVWLDLMYQPNRFLNFLPANRAVSLDDTLQYTELLSRVIDYRSPFTAMHSAGVAATAEALAGLHDMSDVERRMMRIAGNLHDIGKLKIPREILEKPGKLTPEEFNVMKEHAYFTHVILKDIRGFEQIAAWASLHHEKLNGTGYPFHLKAEAIPLGARIMAVADVFSAITEDRPYRRGMDRTQALDVLRGDAARGALSGSVVERLIGHYDEINAVRDQAAHTAGKRYYDALAREDDPTK